MRHLRGEKFRTIGLATVLGLSLMLGIHALAFAQSGAPNLLQFHGRLVDPRTNQPITTLTQIRVQIIQGGAAEESPSTGRLVFSEQVEVKPDEKGEFDYVIGSNANADRTSTTLTAADLNTTRPVFVEIALVRADGTVQVLLPRQRMVSVGFALQAADAAVDDRFVNVEGDTMIGPLRILDSLRVGAGGPNQVPGDAFVAGTLQVGAASVRINGAGIRFPDGTIQTTTGVASVMHDATLMGNGMSSSPLGIAPAGVGTTQLADGAVTSAKISPGAVGMPQLANGAVGTTQLADGAVTSPKIASGQVVKSLHGLFDNITLAAVSPITITPAGNTLTIAAPNALSAVSHDGTLMGNGMSGSPLGIADAGVGTTQLANGAVTAAKISPGAVGMPQLANGAVGTAQLADGAVTSPKIPSGQVVKSLNGLFDSVTLVGAGPNLTITPAGNTLTIAAPNALSAVSHDSTLTGNGTNSTPLGVNPALNLKRLLVGNDFPFSPTGAITAFSRSSPVSFEVGVHGIGLGSDIGVRGSSGSGAGVVGFSFSGNIFEGFGVTVAVSRFRVTNSGQVRSDVGFTTPAADFAEMTEVEESGRQADAPPLSTGRCPDHQPTDGQVEEMLPALLFTGRGSLLHEARIFGWAGD